MNSFKPAWYVVYTRPQHEKRVAEQLCSSGIEHFLPLVKNLRQWSDRKKYIDAPLFPSYVFVKPEDNRAYFRSLELNGILYYVKTGKQVAAVDESVIQNLKHVLSLAGDSVAVTHEHFTCGEKLVICEGPFVGFACEMIRHNGKHKALVRIDLIQRNVLADIPVENLRATLAPVFN